VTLRLQLLLREFRRRHWNFWLSGHDASPSSGCLVLGWTVKPLLSKAAIKLRLICSLLIVGFSLVNTGFLMPTPNPAL